jgi:hypothetical protein
MICWVASTRSIPSRVVCGLDNHGLTIPYMLEPVEASMQRYS